MKYTAVNDGLYRYELEFNLSDKGKDVSIIMVNPSKADGVIKDATIRKLDGFGSRLGWKKYTVVNIHAYRATDINELKNAMNPVGDNNLHYIVSAILKTEMTFVAWGSLSKLPNELRNNWKKVSEIAKILNRDLHCFGVCKDGHPKHPVMIGYNSPVQKWIEPDA